MMRNFAPDITAAWTPVTPLEMELVKQETNPRLVQFGAATDSVIACKFTVEFAARSGVMNWLWPDGLLAPVREALSNEGGGGGGGGAAARKPQQPWGPILGAALREAQLDTRAVLAEAKVSLRQLVQLAPGDIIPIEAPQQVTLLAGDVPLYQGRFGVSQGRNALKIVSGVSS
jgi:flagellar motor switch protein FliM